MGTEQGDYFKYRNIDFVEFRDGVSFDGLRHSVGALNKNEADYLFVETVEITGSAIATRFQRRNSSEARPYLRNRAIARAKARLEAGDYAEDGTGRYIEKINTLSIQDQQQTIDEGIIQHRILKTLYNIRRMNPAGYKSDHFELEGFCALYNIKREQVIYILTLLEEKDIIGAPDIASGQVYITAKGIDYLKSFDNPVQKKTDQPEPRQYDVFISHASEDKISVAEPLAKALTDNHGLLVWYDKWTIKIGDSLRQKIDEGLASSSFGVVVLSPSFFNKRWPPAELDGLFQRETRSGKKVILPIVHEMTMDEVCAYSPLVSGKLALDTAIGIPEIARQIAEVVLERDIEVVCEKENDSDVRGIGLLVGHARNARIENCHASGKITVGGNATGVGGLVGTAENTVIEDSSANVDIEITGNAEGVGGLVGISINSEVEQLINSIELKIRQLELSDNNMKTALSNLDLVKNEVSRPKRQKAGFELASKRFMDFISAVGSKIVASEVTAQIDKIKDLF